MSLHPTKNYFADYHNQVFVETGTWRGDGIDAAIKAGFIEIHSLDNDQKCIDFCRNRFDLVNKNNSSIKLHQVNSAVGLWDVIKGINKRITFWLDAHWQMLEETDPGPSPFPLLEEIEQISRHHIKNHIIMIDDCLIMQWNITGYDLNLVKTRIENINPNYKFKMLPNPVINGIMVAQVK